MEKLIFHLNSIEKDETLVYSSWFRAKYAETIRQGKTGSKNEDFEKLAPVFIAGLETTFLSVE